jgi:hypothetical protein
MQKKKFPYRAIFTSVAHVLVNQEREDFLAQASLEDLKSLIPDEVLKSKALLPIAFPAFTVNLPNKNQDIILAEDALPIYKGFIHQQVNRSHNQAIPIGHIVGASLSRYSPNYSAGVGNNILTEDEVKKNIKKPFNVALAAALYWVTDEDYLQQVEDSADPNSENYMMITASFEVAFDDYQIMRKSPDISKAEFITDAAVLEELKPLLKAFKGKGVDENNEPIYRVMKGEIVPVGIALTTRPAGTVKGIVTIGTAEISNSAEKSVNANAIVEISEESSKNREKSVNGDTDMKQIKTLDELKAVKQEDLAQVAHASIIEVVEKGIEDANVQYTKKLTEKDDAIKTATQNAQAAQEKADKLEKDLLEVNKKLQENDQKALAQAKEQTFQTRMSSINDTFELDEKQVTVVAKQIKDLDEAGFTGWLEGFEAFAAKKTKVKFGKDGKPIVDEKEVKDGKKEEKLEAKAELVDKDAETQRILDEAKAKESQIAAAKTIEDTKADLKQDFTLGEGIILTK